MSYLNSQNLLILLIFFTKIKIKQFFVDTEKFDKHDLNLIICVLSAFIDSVVLIIQIRTTLTAS